MLLRDASSRYPVATGIAPQLAVNPLLTKLEAALAVGAEITVVPRPVSKTRVPVKPPNVA